MGRNGMNAVDIEIQWQRLISFLSEAALTIVKTSFSKIVSEGGDFGCLLYDREGRMIAQDTGVSSKLAPSPRTVTAILQRFGTDDISEGDVFITNDPWLCCGHLYDISVIKPLFHHGRLVGFAETMAHVPDIGGSLSSDAREVFEEGLSLPVVHLLRGGHDVPEVWALIRANVRVPDQLEGDIRAFIAALYLDQRRVTAFLEDNGLEDLQPIADEIITRSEAAMRAGLLATIPAGKHRNTILLDGVETDEPLSVSVSIERHEDGSVTVDYDGTGPQSAVGINCTEAYTEAWTAYAIRCIVAPHIPYNAGLLSPVRLKAPSGTFLNARHPAPVRMKSSTGNFIPAAIFGALAEVAPDRMIAESGIKCVIRCFGTDAQGRNIAETPHFMGGLGARSSKDGVSCMSFPAAGAETPVEMLENSLPLTVTHKSLISDSGGAGRYRGGLGQSIGLRCESDRPLSVLVQNIKVHTLAAGYAGGGAGGQGYNRLGGRTLPGKTQVRLSLGDELEIGLSGGGGMSDPHRRPLAEVLADVAEGWVSREAAATQYGVALHPDGTVDEVETLRLREPTAASAALLERV
ncbi:hydantoinase B/oxoprolinase family protein [Shinella sp. CPCC 100929]|uniref:Hydantoinase B/oxoprolinase family protein n=1 Tax=Shinella lacus TaxID=2654216 RepID=A0ABT1R1G1_9HYPH|nr:hydantoinase B/oxoprolinase family protein [Shinella lacus]MCQ4629013.1 hydantoinase B/oxoprolinase family protein [Shinella lacus]